MDAFFASCEEAVNPSYRGKPLIVGGTKTDLRSIVSCGNYAARARGVKTAMALSKAIQLVPDGIFIRHTRGIYSDYSHRVQEVFRKYSPLVQQVSIDESYIDVSGVLHDYENNPVQLAETIKNDIQKTLHITCSIGISSNKTCSKIASKLNKPNGITYVPFGKEKEFLSKLEVSRIPGVGKATQKILDKYGIKLIGDILKYDKSFYENEIGSYAVHLLDIANGIDSREVRIEEGERKSLSNEETFDHDTDDMEYLKKELYYILEKSCARLRKHKITARNITVKVKYYDFTVNQKSFTRGRYSNIEMDYFDDAIVLLQILMQKRKKIRLLGAKFADLVEEDKAYQEKLFDDEDRNKTIALKLDEIRKKYSYDIIKFGKTFD